MHRPVMILAAMLGLIACTPMAVAPAPATPLPGDVVVPGPIGVDPVPVIPVPVPVTDTPAGVVDQAADALGRASIAVDRAWTAYVVIRGAVNMVRPFMSPERAAQVGVVQQAVERAFQRARVASDLAVQAIELKKAAEGAGLLSAWSTPSRR